jgi:hypothetical protein
MGLNPIHLIKKCLNLLRVHFDALQAAWILACRALILCRRCLTVLNHQHIHKYVHWSGF